MSKFAALSLCLILGIGLSACKPQDPPVVTSQWQNTPSQEPGLVREAASRFGLDLLQLPLIQTQTEFPYITPPENYDLMTQYEANERKFFVVGGNLVPFTGQLQQRVLRAKDSSQTHILIQQQLDREMKILGAEKLNASPIPQEKYTDLDQNFSSHIVDGEVHTYGFRLDNDQAVLIQLSIGQNIEYLVMQTPLPAHSAFASNHAQFAP